MKKNLIFTFLLVCFLADISISQTWQWAKSAHGDFDDWGSAIAVDASGNTYV
jgi:hypothetical protein